MIRILEDKLGLEAAIDFEDIQPGDVKSTFADIEHSKNMLGYYPKTNLSKGFLNLLTGINRTTVKK